MTRNTLLTFNDANMTGNYFVFLAKASKQMRAQLSTDQLVKAFEASRANKLFFEDVATADYDSLEKAQFDLEGA